MPAKPAWYGNLDAVIAALEALPRPMVDSATLERLLGVGRRRAQQILAACVTERLGASGLAEPAQLIDHLRRLATGEAGYYERRRRRRLARQLDEMRQAWVAQPKLLVEASGAIARQRLERLPAGIRLESGRIVVEFDTPGAGLQKLLALAMAISNDPDEFERLTAG